MREGYRLTGDRYRLGRGPVWKHNDIGGLDSRFVDFSLDSNCWLADLGHSLSGARAPAALLLNIFHIACLRFHGGLIHSLTTGNAWLAALADRSVFSGRPWILISLRWSSFPYCAAHET